MAHLAALYNLTLIYRGNPIKIARSYRGWLRGMNHVYSLTGEVRR